MSPKAPRAATGAKGHTKPTQEQINNPWLTPPKAPRPRLFLEDFEGATEENSGLGQAPLGREATTNHQLEISSKSTSSED